VICHEGTHESDCAQLDPVATAPGSVFVFLLKRDSKIKCFMLGCRFVFAIGLGIRAMEEREEFLTARQLAKILQVSESTVRRLARKRRIPSVRVTPHIIRFHLDAVREALDVPRSRIRHGEYTEQIDDAQLSFEDLMLT
jgi:excisionase family DNA binding protein